MTRSEMAFILGLVLWYFSAAHNAPTAFAWWGGALVLVGYFTAPRMRISFHSDLPRPPQPAPKEKEPTS